MFDWLKKSGLWLWGGSSTGTVERTTVGNGGIRYSTGGNDLPSVDEAGSLAIGAVFACVNLISRNLATLPFSVYKAVGEASVKHPQHFLHSLVHDQPNPAMTSFDWRCAVFANELLWGNAFTWIQSDVTGKPMALYPLRSDRMTVEVNGANVAYIYQTGSRKIRYEAHEICHHKHFSLDGVMGISPIEQSGRTLQLSQAVEKFGSATFANSARPSGLLTHPGALSAEAAQRMRENFDKAYSGPDRAGKLIVLEEGLSYTPVSFSPVDAEYISATKLSVSGIARIFGVPEVLIGQLDRPTYGSIADLKNHFLTFTLLPLIKSFEMSLNAKLFDPGAEYYARMNFDGFLRADQKTRFESYQIGRNIGVYSVNDIRALEQMSPVDNGDTRIEPLNMTPLGGRTQLDAVA